MCKMKIDKIIACMYQLICKMAIWENTSVFDWRLWKYWVIYGKTSLS